MLFRGQGVVEFSGANYSADAFRYDATTGPYVNYTDEAIYFTSDPAIVNSFRRKVRRFLGRHRQLGRLREHHRPTDARRAGRDLPDRPAAQLPARPELSDPIGLTLQRCADATSGRGVDVIMYRITDQQHHERDDWLEGRGVPVRLITEQAQYRLVDRMWHSWNVDRLYMAGSRSATAQHAGLNHQKSVIIYDQDAAAGDQTMVIFGSSNWTSPSASGQVEHNMFTTKSESDVLVHRSVRAQVEQPGAGRTRPSRSSAAARRAEKPYTREPGDRRRPGDHSALEWRSLGAPLRPTDRDRPELYRCRLFVQSRDGSEPPREA